MAIQALFYGSIQPVDALLGFEEPIQYEPEGGGQVQLIVSQGRFQALVTQESFDDIPSYVTSLLAEVQGFVDSLGFHLGLAATVHLDGAPVGPDKAIFHRHGFWPEAAGRTSADAMFIDAQALQPFTRAAIEELLVRVALADIRLAIAQPADTAFHAYRAVESVRQWFADTEPPTDSRSEGWRRLRETLSVEEGELRSLANLALHRRHGRVMESTEAERLWAITLARRVVLGLVEHMAGSSAQLPE